MIRLSIIVPFYNVEKYIEQCIRSIYDQDIPREEYEVICVDDCSPDGSRAIVERLQTEFPTLRLIIHEKNKKLGGARNTGLRSAKGDYIWFVDSDDFIAPNVLGVILNAAESNTLDVLVFDYKHYHNVNRIDGCGDPIFPTDILCGVDFFFSPNICWWKHLVVVWRKIYRREFLVKNDLFFAENIMYEDNAFSLLTFSIAQRVMHKDILAYYYRYNESSVCLSSIRVDHVYYWAKNATLVLEHFEQFNRVDKKFVVAVETFAQNMIYKVTSCLKEMDKSQLVLFRKMYSISDLRTLIGHISKKSLVHFLLSVYSIRI